MKKILQLGLLILLMIATLMFLYFNKLSHMEGDDDFRPKTSN